MGLKSIIFRTTARRQIAASLTKCFSTSCDKGGKSSIHEPCSYCMCCNRPSGGDKGSKNMYNSRKYGPNLPANVTTPCFEPLPGMPSGIFRTTCGETLGPQGQASKCGMYKNPEYFSYHHMTFYDMQMALKRFRKPRVKTGRKPL